MIKLQLPIQCDAHVPAFVCRIEAKHQRHFGDDGMQVKAVEGGGCVGRFHGQDVYFPSISPEELWGDILLVVPTHKTASRLIRSSSKHNTLLFTEQCDQLCVMCSQPPKKINDSWRLKYYKKAIRLADKGVQIGISGGEPTLQRDLFFDFVEEICTFRPDISLHILSNGQHFLEEDLPFLRRLHQRQSVLWGIPLYSEEAKTHDQIVLKEGAFEVLLPNLFRLASTHAQIELRTVITGLNYHGLPNLSNFISKNLFFIKIWALMGLEPIGFARAFKHDLFVDHSNFTDPLEHALDIARMKRLNTRLYNIPLCTVSKPYRGYCADTISDWKKKYVPECADCECKGTCSGFFEWYNEDWKYAKVNALSKVGDYL